MLGCGMLSFLEMRRRRLREDGPQLGVRGPGTIADWLNSGPCMVSKEPSSRGVCVVDGESCCGFGDWRAQFGPGSTTGMAIRKG